MTTVAKIMELAGIPLDAQFVTAAQMDRAMAIAKEQGEAAAIARTRTAPVAHRSIVTPTSSARSETAGDRLNAAIDRLCAEKGIEPTPAPADGLDAAIGRLIARNAGASRSARGD